MGTRADKPSVNSPNSRSNLGEMCSLEKRGDIYVLTISGPGQHRLNPTLLDAIQAALRRLRSEVTAGSTCSALITTAEGKFFSNGFDLDWAKGSVPRIRLMSSKLRSVAADLIQLPMPTIAAVTGHASAGGFVLALCHDYILMRKDRGFLYMSEVDIGLVIPEWFVTVLRAKVGDPKARRRVVLRAPKLVAEEAVEMGIVDSAHDGAEETVAAAVKLGEGLVQRKWIGEVYGQNREKMLSDVLVVSIRFVLTRPRRRGPFPNCRPLQLWNETTLIFVAHVLNKL